jgi:O-antigen ligase
MLLSGTRAAFLAGIVAVAIVPLTLRIGSLRSLVLTVTLIVVAVPSIIWYVPSSSWERMLTIREELSGGTMTGRTGVWRAGLNAFQERPLVGFGAGAFGTAVAVSIPEHRMRFAHNALLSVLVEQGVVGLFLYSVLLAACAWTITRLQPPERTLWAVLMLSWLVGVMSLSWEYHKLTWLLFGLLAAQRVGEGARRRVRAAQRLSPDSTPHDVVDGSQGRWISPGSSQPTPRRPSPALPSR